MRRHLLRLLTAVFLLALPCTALRAQRFLPQPLTYVPADSVVVWGEGLSDLRGVAMLADANPGAAIADTPAADSSRLYALWQSTCAPHLSPAGLWPRNKSKARREHMGRTTAMVHHAARLFLLTGDGALMDAAERALYNDVLTCAVDSLAPTADRHLAAKALFASAGMVYATQGNGLWVNLFTNSTTRIRTAQFACVIDQLTAMPFGPRHKIRLSSLRRSQERIVLHLRLPVWAISAAQHSGQQGLPKGAPLVCINGREALGVTYADGYVVIDRRWRNGDEVMIEWPLSPRPQTVGSRNALCSGPLVLLPADGGSAHPLPKGPWTEETDEAGYPAWRTGNRLWMPMVRCPKE